MRRIIRKTAKTKLPSLDHKTISRRNRISVRIDKIVTSRYFGFPILVLSLWLLFQMTFTIGKYPQIFIEHIFNLMASGVDKYLCDGAVKSLLINGVLSGVGGVVVFLPNILLLFLGISLMEDSGYMARAAYQMDRVMHAFGLHGKSFISLTMGFGCNVPAIMSARSLENTQDRIITILINPFMSCSARLPVYILFAGTFFEKNAGAVIASLYFIGILLALLSARLFRLLFFKDQRTPSTMELPSYKVPMLKPMLVHVWNRGAEYLKKIAGVILIFSIAIWILGEYPKSDAIKNEYTKKLAQLETDYKQKINIKTPKEYNSEKEKLLTEQHVKEIQYTYIGKIGDFIYPAIAPLGFTREMGISLATGIAAKEIVVSTLGVLYNISETKPDHNTSLSLTLRRKNSGITPLAAYSFMLFVLLYIPCLGTFTVIGREAGWGWAVFSVAYQLLAAWALSYFVYNAGMLLWPGVS